jgi:LacI family transcriptional regulator
LFVANNLMVIGVMRGLAELGLSVPRDVALTAFDDFEWSDLFQPRMTTIAQPTHGLGREAVRLVLDRIANPGLEPRVLRLEPRIVHRESCGCPPGAPDPWAKMIASGVYAAARRGAAQPDGT